MAVIAAAACSPAAPANNAGSDGVAIARAPADPGAQTGLMEGPLTIRTAAAEHRFTVEVAATYEQQVTGMMFRRSIAPDRGMIFPYDPPQAVAFWMKNTLIPLDMIFIRADGKIARVATAVPLTLDLVSAGEPVAAVLEIAGGRAAELGVREGDRVDW